MMAEETTALRKRENTRARLRAAAAEVLVAKGFEGARIDDIVKAAGYTRGAFYSNYSSMDELINDVLIERSQRILQAIEEAFASIEGVPDLDDVMAVLDAFAAEGRRMYILTSEFNLYLLRRADRDDRGRDFPIAEKQRIETAIARILEGVLARMGRRPLLPTPTVASILVTIYLDSFSPNRPFEADGPVLRSVIDAVIVAFSEAAETGGDPERSSEPQE